MYDLKEGNLFKEHLLNLALDKSVTVFEIETFLYFFFKDKPLPISKIAFANYCRCSINQPKEMFTTVGRCSYNPDVKKINLQRCNYPGQQVFYASVPLKAKVKAHQTAILEVSLSHLLDTCEKYYFLTLSEWITERELNIFYFPDVELGGAVTDKPDYQKLLYEHPHIIDKDVPFILEVFQFFNDILCRLDNKEAYYRISSAFYNCIMRLAKDSQMLIDGMVYSSSNSKKLGTNIVLNKQVIDDGILKCHLVQMAIAERNPHDSKDIWFHKASDEVHINSDNTFGIQLYEKFSKIFEESY